MSFVRSLQNDRTVVADQLPLFQQPCRPRDRHQEVEISTLRDGQVCLLEGIHRQTDTVACLAVSTTTKAVQRHLEMTPKDHHSRKRTHLGALEYGQRLRCSFVIRVGRPGGPLVDMVELYQGRYFRFESEQSLLRKEGAKMCKHGIGRGSGRETMPTHPSPYLGTIGCSLNKTRHSVNPSHRELTC